MYIGEVVEGELIVWDEWGRGESLWLVLEVGLGGFWAMGRERKWFCVWEMYCISKLE
jgi:hypothetical protein